MKQFSQMINPELPHPTVNKGRNSASQQMGLQNSNLRKPARGKEPKFPPRGLCTPQGQLDTSSQQQRATPGPYFGSHMQISGRRHLPGHVPGVTNLRKHYSNRPLNGVSGVDDVHSAKFPPWGKKVGLVTLYLRLKNSTA